MTFVENFSKTLSCPHCGNSTFMGMYNQDTDVSYKECYHCHEEIYSLKDQDKVTRYEFNVGKAPDDIDDSLMNIEYEVGNLPRYATTKEELAQLERIRDIFNEFISVIRRMK